MKNLLTILALSTSMASAADVVCPSVDDVVSKLSGPDADVAISKLFPAAASAYLHYSLKDSLQALPYDSAKGCEYAIGSAKVLTIVPNTGLKRK